MEAVIVILVATLILLAVAYSRGIRQRNHVTNLLLLVLLDDRVYRAQQVGLKRLCITTTAKDPNDLAGKIMASTGNLADNLAETMLGVSGMLWKLRQSSGNA